MHYPNGTGFVFSEKRAMDRLFLYRLILENTFFLECFFSSFWYFIPINPYVSGFFLFADLKIFGFGIRKMSVHSSGQHFSLQDQTVKRVRFVRTGEILAVYSAFSLYQTGLDCFFVRFSENIFSGRFCEWRIFSRETRLVYAAFFQNVKLFEKLVLKVMFNARKTLVFDIFRIASRNWYFGEFLQVQMGTKRLLYSGFEWGEQFVGGGNG